MLLTDARRAARTDDDGWLVPLDRATASRWDADGDRRGPQAAHRTLGTTPVGPYQVQAAIAALHDEATTAEETDWPQILALYEVLDTHRARAACHAQPSRGARTRPRAHRRPLPWWARSTVMTA